MLKLFAVCVALTLMSTCQGHMPDLSEFLEGLLEGDDDRTTMAPTPDPNMVHSAILVDRFQPYHGAACNDACRKMTSEFTQKIVAYNIWQMKMMSSKFSGDKYRLKFVTKKYSIMDVVIVYVISMDGAPGNMTTAQPVTPGNGTPGTTRRPGTPSPPVTDAPTTTTQGGAAVDFDFECSFEVLGNAWCGIEQSAGDVFNWTLNSGSTGSTGTGPDGAADGNNYIYIEASSPRQAGDDAIILLPSVPAVGQYCLSFFYHMFGLHMGSLEVWTRSADDFWVQKWNITGGQHSSGNAAWTEQAVTLNMQANMQVAFRGTRMNDYQGDMGLDEIELTGDFNQC